VQTETDRKPISYEDITKYTINVENDRYGHVNYKTYLELFEPALNTYLLDRGLTLDDLEQKYGLKSIILTYTVTVHSESFKGDKIIIETKINKIGNTSFTLVQSMKREKLLIADLTMVIVLTNKEGKPTSIPENIKSRFQNPKF